VSAARQGRAAVHRIRIDGNQALELAELGLSEACDDVVLLASATRAAWLAGLVPDAVAHAEKLLAVARATGEIETEALAPPAPGSVSSGNKATTMGWTARPTNSSNWVERLPERHELRQRPREHRPELHVAATALSKRSTGRIAPSTTATPTTMPEIKVWGEAEKGSVLIGLPELAGRSVKRCCAGRDRSRSARRVLGGGASAQHSVRSEVLSGPDTTEARDTLARMRRAAERAGFDSLSGPGYWQGLAGLAEWDGDLMKALEYLERDGGAIAGRSRHITRPGI